MTDVYDTLKSGGSVDWTTLDESGKYEVWSVHIEAGGMELSYPTFCNLLDAIYKI